MFSEAWVKCAIVFLLLDNRYAELVSKPESQLTIARLLPNFLLLEPTGNAC
jgi:hypothetical protein